MNNNIILIGFMGSGKTSVGIRLSHYLKYTMTDTDKWIENRQKMSVSRIFDKLGEKAFRDMETQCLRELAKTADRQVISVGGGLPIRKENHPLLKNLGKVFYLKAEPETVYERLKNDTARPLLQVENPKEKIRELLQARSPIYEACADETVEVSRKTPEEIVKEIAERI